MSKWEHPYGFWLGTHQTQWLGYAGFPLFVSHTRLRVRKSMPRAVAKWALDSGGFTQLQMHGGWENVTEVQYVSSVRRYVDEIGLLDWAAPMDWMCEPSMLTRTGKTIEDHQRLTTYNYLTLKMLAPELPFIPVLQGWSIPDYFRHADLYYKHGVELDRERIVGVGSVCRRQGTREAERLMYRLHAQGMNLHGFGFKIKGLEKCVDCLTSSDSMAWSFDARRKPALPGCDGHKNCANCIRYAMRWRDRLIDRLNKMRSV
jgi:hypothetical protein